MYDHDRLANYGTEYYTRPVYETWFKDVAGLLRPDETAAFAYAWGQAFFRDDQVSGKISGRHPGLVYSIGCGLGFLESKLEIAGVEVIGVDPSPGAKALYRGKRLVNAYSGGGDTILFVESIEHLTMVEIQQVWSAVPAHAWIIIVNIPGFFPIPATSDWDHVTTVDDALYDYLSAGRHVLVRQQGHLVLGGTL